jgi:nitrogen fixation NifU-like protein
MSDLKSLYQEIILEHYRKPRNFGPLAPPAADVAVDDREAAGHNPLCGDRVKVFVRLDGGRVQDIAFEGAGCAISTASASLMTEAVKGKTLAEAEDLFQAFHQMVTGQAEPADDPTADDSLGSLEALAGVRDLPVRIKCATLAWHTLHAALEEKHDPVSTE